MSKKDWESAWTPQKIRQNAEKWKLSGDAGLLLHLEDTSNRLFETFHRTENILRTLDRNLKFTGIRLENTINEFSMLSNKQFIENRVYDEDVVISKTQLKKDTAESAKSKELREAEMLEAVKYCLQKGCAMVDNCFEKIDIRPEDFDEDDDPTFRPEPIYEPKDPFVRRPLPLIIGTSAFENSRFIGLKNEETSKETEENLSDEEIEEILPPPPKRIQIEGPPAPTLSVPESVSAPMITVPQLITEDFLKDKGPGSDNSGLFYGSAESDQHDDPLFDDTPKYKILGNDSTSKKPPVPTNTGASSNVTKQIEKSPLNFASNLAASSSLFDDDEGDVLFSPAPKKNPVIISKSSSSSSVDQYMNKPTPKNALPTVIQPKSDNIANLFDETDDDDDGDLFSSKKLPSKKTPSETKNQIIGETNSVVNKSDSLDMNNKQTDDSLTNVVRSTSGVQNDPRKLLANALVSNLAKSNLNSVDGHKSEEKNVIVTSKSTSSSVDQYMNKPTPKNALPTVIQPKSDNIANLFDETDDDDDGDLFSSKKLPSKKTPSETKNQIIGETNSVVNKSDSLDMNNKQTDDSLTNVVRSTSGVQNDPRKLLANALVSNLAKSNLNSVDGHKSEEKNGIVTSKSTSSSVDQSLSKQISKGSSLPTSIQPKSNKFLANLFDDNDDDADGDLFSTIKSSNKPVRQMGNRQSYDLNSTDDVSPDPLSSKNIPEKERIVVQDEIISRPSSTTVTPQNDPRKLLVNILISNTTKTSSESDDEKPKTISEISPIIERKTNESSPTYEPLHSETTLLPSLQKTRAKIPTASRRLPTKRSPVSADNQTNLVSEQIEKSKNFYEEEAPEIPTPPKKVQIEEQPPTTPSVLEPISTSVIAVTQLIAKDNGISSGNTDLFGSIPEIDPMDDPLFGNTQKSSENVATLNKLPVSKILGASSNVTKLEESPANFTASGLLFDDDEDDDIFATVPKKTQVVASKSSVDQSLKKQPLNRALQTISIQSKSEKSTTNLFDETDDDEDDIFSTKKSSRISSFDKNLPNLKT